MKKGILKIALITFLSVVLILCLSIGVFATDEVENGVRVKSSPAYDVLYGYTLHDALTEEGVLTMFDDGEVTFRVPGGSVTKVAGSWTLADDPADPDDLNTKITKDNKEAYAVFTPKDLSQFFVLNVRSAHIYVIAATPTMDLSVDSASQNIGKDVKLSFSVAHPKYEYFTDGLPTEFVVKADAVDSEGAFIRNISSETVSAVSEYTFTVPADVSPDEYISFTVTSSSVENKYTSVSKSVKIDVLPKVDVSENISFSVSDITYGETPSFGATFGGQAHGEGGFTYKIARDGTDNYVDISALANASGLLDAGKYNVKAYYEDKSQYGEEISSFTVNKKTLGIGIDNLSELSKEYDGTDALVTSPEVKITGLVTGEIASLSYLYKYSSKNAEAVKVVVYNVAFDGTTSAVDKNYTIGASFEFDGVNITKRVATVTPKGGQSKIYLDADPEFLYDVSGLVDGDTLEGKLGRAAGEDFGSYAFDVSGLTNPNYTVALAENAPKFEIISKGLHGATITLENDGELVYNGKAQTIGISKIYVGNYEITEYEVTGNTATDVGEYTITITSTTDNFVGSATVTWKITEKDISGATVTMNDRLTYNGSEQTMTVTVTVDGIKVDTYTVENNSATNAGLSYVLTVVGTGNFKGSVSAIFSIAPFDISSMGVGDAVIEGTELTYNGTAQHPTIKEVFGFQNPTYTVEGAGVSVGSYTAVFKGTGNFTGSVRISYTISPFNISGAQITFANTLTYNGFEQIQSVLSVTAGGLPVTFGTLNNKATNAGEYTLTVYGTGNFTGSATKNFTVQKKNIKDAVITLGDDLEYNGSLQTQEILQVKIGSLTVTYDVTGNTATEIGDYVLTITGNGNFTGSITKKWSIYSKTIASAEVVLKEENFVYDGNPHTQEVLSVTIDGVPITYEVSGNTATEAGEHTITIVGTGSFVGTKRVVFKIAPRDITGAEVKLTDFPTYDGTPKQVGVTSFTLPGYNATYGIRGNIESLVGVYTLTVFGTGNFGGEISITWKILPDESKIGSLTESDVTSASRTDIIDLKNSISTDSAKTEWMSLIERCDALLTVIDAVALEIGSIEDAVCAYSLENVKTSDKETLAALLVRVDTLLQGSNLTADERSLASETRNTVAALTEKIGEVEAKISEIKSGIEKYDKDTVKTTDNDAVTTLENDIAELINSENLTEEEHQSLLDMQLVVVSLKDKINAVIYGMDEIKSAVDSILPDELNYSDREKFETAYDTVTTLLETQNLTDSEREVLEGYKTVISEYLDVIMSEAADIAEIEELLSVYTLDNVKASDVDPIFSILDKIKALLADTEISEAKKNRLSELKLEAENLIWRAYAVEEEITAIKNEVKNFVDNNPKIENKDAVIAILERVTALLTSDNLTDEERAEMTSVSDRMLAFISYLESERYADISSILDKIYAYNVDTVKSSDKADINALRKEVISMLENGSEAEIEILDLGIDAIDKLLKRISDVSERLNSELITSYIEKNITKETLLLSDKGMLHSVISEFSDLIFIYEANLTAEERELIDAHISTAESFIAIIEKVSAVQDLINSLPSAEGVEPFDQQSINALSIVIKKYTELSADELRMLDTAKMDALTRAIYVYKIVRGGGAEKILGDGKALHFQTNVSPMKFTAVKVNGVTLENSNYICQSDGSLILTESYLDSLGLGEYTLTLVYQNGEAKATFKVIEPSTNVGLIIALVVSGVGVVGVAVVYFLNKRRLSNK